MENTEKSRKTVFLQLKNENYPRKSLFLEYFEVKLIIKNLRLVKLDC